MILVIGYEPCGAQRFFRRRLNQSFGPASWRAAGAEYIVCLFGTIGFDEEVPT